MATHGSLNLAISLEQIFNSDAHVLAVCSNLLQLHENQSQKIAV